ncbi:hypothetical protein CANCADRAFT_44273 [Tortispora caseinolytica NRRL Y-17796]|uniref:t-SNARE coiled-coil homology domain-containing protein n=1 Tax=Tortispora caseinolytica NRRL Y-17796 TaxID=767744 RepID=A0A1E4TFZ2_9ASCO|nr:hypothetical protein CANCADRAFT_44273 [Tortispora caseinolytica NRRL Y-17796]
MDLTHTYQQYTKTTPQKIPHKPDAFEIEARRVDRQIINLTEKLRSARKSYLRQDGRGMSDADKDDIDFTVRQVLKQLVVRVRHIEEAAKQTTAGVRSWRKNKAAIEAKRKHRYGITMYLNARLEALSHFQATLQEARLQEQLERERNVTENLKTEIIDTRPVPNHQDLDTSFAESYSYTYSDPTDMDGLSAQMMTELKEENDQMSKIFEQTIEQTRKVAKSLQDIGDMHNELSQHLHRQRETVDFLMTNASTIEEDMSAAGKELRRARDRDRKTVRSIYVMTAIFSTVLITLHIVIP